MPQDCSYLTLHYPFGVLYKEPLVYIEEELKSNETIVHCYHSLLVLESTSLCPFGELCVLPKLAIKRWRIELVEAQVEDSVSPVRRSADRVCHYCISNLLIEIYFPVQFMFILNMNIDAMDVFNFLYMIDYI